MPSSISETASTATEVRDAIRARAREEGFDAVGIASAVTPQGAAEGLTAFLDQGLHGDMGWMEANAERRADPKRLWNETKSIITLGANYGPSDDPMAALTRRERGVISVYAQGADYHDVLKKRLKRLASWIAESYGS